MNINYFLVSNHKGNAIFAILEIIDNAPELTEISQFSSLKEALTHCHARVLAMVGNLSETALINYLETNLAVYMNSCVGQYYRVKCAGDNNFWRDQINVLSTAEVNPKELSQFIGSQSISIDTQLLRVLMNKDITQDSLENDLFIELLALFFVAYPSLSTAYSWIEEI